MLEFINRICISALFQPYFPEYLMYRLSFGIVFMSAQFVQVILAEL